MKDKGTKSKGGYARAEALTPEERKNIARKAAQSRWNADVPKSYYEGEFPVGDSKISAAVLANGKRILTQATFLRAIGRSRSPKAGTGVLSTVDGTPFFLQAEVLKPFISEELLASTTPIFYIAKGGKKMVGYDAELLPNVAEVYLKMRDSYIGSDKPVPSNFAHIVNACDIVMRGLARVGIIALVDEATGFQDVRDRRALQAILERYLTEEKAKWAKTFPDDFYKEIFRLCRWSYDPASVKRPAVIGKITNDIVYSRLQPGILAELQKRNPKTQKGYRKDKHFQYFTQDYGMPELRQHILNLIFLMRSTNTWQSFKALLNQTAPKVGDNLELPFDYSEIDITVPAPAEEGIISST